MKPPYSSWSTCMDGDTTQHSAAQQLVLGAHDRGVQQQLAAPGECQSLVNAFSSSSGATTSSPEASPSGLHAQRHTTAAPVCVCVCVHGRCCYCCISACTPGNTWLLCCSSSLRSGLHLSGKAAVAATDGLTNSCHGLDASCQHLVDDIIVPAAGRQPQQQQQQQPHVWKSIGWCSSYAGLAGV